MEQGTPIPPLVAVLADGRTLRLDKLTLPAVIYFYPKNDTAGCTREAQDFSVLGEQFAAAGISVARALRRNR